MASGRQQFYSAFRQVVAALSLLNGGWLPDQFSISDHLFIDAQSQLIRRNDSLSKQSNTAKTHIAKIFGKHGSALALLQFSRESKQTTIVAMPHYVRTLMRRGF